MELWSSLQVLWRRWYICIPILLVFAGLGLFLARSIAPTYRADGRIVFLRQADGAGTTASSVNPWQSADYSMNQFALLMGQATESPAFADQFASAGGSGSFTVETSAREAQGSPANQTPTLSLTTNAATPDAALGSYRILVDEVANEVRARQEAVGAPQSTWISVVDLVVPQGAVEQSGSRVGVLIVTGALGLVLALGCSFAFDSWTAVRRRGDRHHRSEDEEAPGEPSDRADRTNADRDERLTSTDGDDDRDDRDDRDDDRDDTDGRVVDLPRPLEATRRDGEDGTIDEDDLDEDDLDEDLIEQERSVQTTSGDRRVRKGTGAAFERRQIELRRRAVNVLLKHRPEAFPGLGEAIGR